MWIELSETKLKKLFEATKNNPEIIEQPEGITVEYKKSFTFNNPTQYFKTMAAFANREGGYLIFGIEDGERKLLGLSEKDLKRFDFDKTIWTTDLNNYFAPELNWDKKIFEFKNKNYGIIYVQEAKNKPVLCKKAGKELRESAIYYRYNAQTTEIKYPELDQILHQEINRLFNKTIQKIGKIGITEAAFLDLKKGKIETPKAEFCIDKNLLKEMSYIREGSFVETEGKPTLKIVGEVLEDKHSHLSEEKYVPTAINEDEIIKSFLKKEQVNNAKEFIKQICCSRSGYLPVYYYMQLAELNIPSLLSYIKGIQTSEQQTKHTLIKRVEEKKIDYIEIKSTDSYASKEKQKYAKLIYSGKLTFNNHWNEKDINYLLQAIRGIHKKTVQNKESSLRALLLEIYNNWFTNEHATLRNYFRRTICWIDEALYLPADTLR